MAATTFHPLFKQLEAGRARKNETNDCAVKAVAVVTNENYDEAHDACQRFGRQPRRGTNFSFTTKPAVKNLGFEVERVHAELTGTFVRKLPERLSARKTYLVRVAGHILAVKGGQVVDWTAARNHRVKAIYEVSKKVEEPKAVEVKPSKPARKSSKRLSDQDVRTIRCCLKTLSIKEVADLNNVSWKTVYNIKTGYSYSEVK
jgi:hypothetical protein